MKPLSSIQILLFIVAVGIGLLQLWSNGYPTYQNLFVYNYVSGIRPMQWINLSAGIITVAVLLIVMARKKKITSGSLTWILLSLVSSNIVLMLVHWFSFFS